MLIRTNLLIVWECANVGLDCKSSAYGLEGSNPSTNLMNMLIGFLVFITLEIATIGFTYFHEDDKNYRKGKNS